MDISVLPLSQQIDTLLQTTGKKRVQLLMESGHMDTIVPLLPATELWLTVAEVGKNDALMVMECATSEQWQTLFDLESWDKDNFDAKKTLAWLATMLEVNPVRTAEWLRALDFNFVLLLGQAMVTVAKREGQDDDTIERMDWPNPLPPWTLDSMYFIQGKTEDSDQLARALFKELAALDMNYFHHFCETIMDVLPTEQAETEYEIRDRRLAEEGIPSYGDAVSIYQPISVAKLKTISARPERLKQGVEKSVAPRFPLVICEDAKLFLSTVVLGIEDGLFLQHWSKELANLATSVMVADQMPLVPDSLRESMKKVVAMLNLAVEAASGGDVEKARGVLMTYWAKNLFQVGCALMRALPKV